MLIAGIAVAVIIGALLAINLLPDMPPVPELMRLQLSRSGAEFHARMKAWDEPAQAAYCAHFLLDYLLIGGYALLGWTLCLQKDEGSCRSQLAGRSLILAAALDVLENLLHQLVLNATPAPADPWFAVAAIAALLKFCLIGLAFVLWSHFILGKAWQRLRSSQR